MPTLALDIGSSSVRARLFDDHGRALDRIRIQRPYSTDTTPDGGVTINPAELIATILDCIDEAAAQVDHIERVAIDTLVSNLVGIGPDDQPTTPIYTWADTRGHEISARLHRQTDAHDYTRRTGARFHTSYWPVRLLWLAQHDPATLKRTAYWLTIGDYLLYRLLGVRRMSYSTASWAGILDRHALAWDQPTLDLLPLTADQLPELSQEPLTGLRREYATRWPALRQARWYPSFGDGVTSNIGGGCARPGYVALSLGTSGAMRVIVAGTPEQTPDGLFVYRVDAERSLVGGALSNAGNVYAWLRQTLQTDDTLADAVGALSPDSHGLTVLPFLAGERAPGWNDRARSVYMGMTYDTRPAHLVRASMEAIAYRFFQIAKRLQPLLPAEVRYVANGAGLVQSPVWMQIMADVLNAPVYASAEDEATIRGAALLALGLDPEPELGPGAQPDPQRHAVYRLAVARQQALYERLFD